MKLIYLGYVTLITAFLLILYVSYYLLWPIKVLDQLEYRVINEKNQRGKPLYVYSKFCKYLSIPATVSIEYLDGLKFSLREFNTNNDTGCKEGVFLSHVIPEYVPAGKYQLRVTRTWKLNALRTITQTMVSNSFEVTE